MAREIPQYVRQLTTQSLQPVQYTDAVEKVYSGISQQLNAVVANMNARDLEIQRLNAERDMSVNMSRLSNEFGSDPAKLKEHLDSYKKGFIGGIKDSDLAAKYEFAYDIEAQNHINRATKKYNDIQDDNHKLSIVQTVQAASDSMRDITANLYSPVPEVRAEAARALQLKQLMVQQAISARGAEGQFLIDPAAQVRIVTNAKDEAGRQMALAWMETQPDKQAALDAWKKGGIRVPMPTDKEGESIEINPRDFMSTDALDSLDGEIHGIARQDMAERKAASEFAEKEEEYNAGMQMVNEAIAGRVVIDPKDKQTEKYINQYVDSGNLSAVDMGKVAIATGVVPARLKTTISGLIINGDIDQQIAASDMLNSMMEQKPLLDTGLDEQTKAMASFITTNVSAGVPKERVAEMAKEMAKPMNLAVIQYRKEELSKNNPLTFEKVASDFNNWYSSAPEIPTAAKTDFEQTAKNYYLGMNIDAEQAKNLALKDIKSKWAVSEVDGNKRMMKYAPELFYAEQGVDNSWMRKQLLKDVSTIPMMLPPDGLGDLQNRVTIVPSPKSINDKKGIAYNVMVRRDDGILEPFFGQDGKPLLWQPDFSKTDEAAEVRAGLKTPEQFKADARKKREYIESIRKTAPSFSRAKIGEAP